MKCLLVENPLLLLIEEKKIEILSMVLPKEEIAKGRQVYFVYPLIEESETLDYKNLMEGFEHISEIFPLPDYNTTMLHGK